MNDKTLKLFVATMTNGEDIDQYTNEGAERKKILQFKGRAVLTDMAAIMHPKDFKIDWNPGGIAVTGDVMMRVAYHNGNFCYITFGGLLFRGEEPRFIYRQMKKWDDWAGMTNQWMPYRRLLDLRSAVETIMATTHGDVIDGRLPEVRTTVEQYPIEGPWSNYPVVVRPAPGIAVTLPVQLSMFEEV